MSERKILFSDKEIKYSLKKSQRARRARVTIYCDGNCVVTVPTLFPENRVERFVREKSDWIVRKLKYFESFNHKLYIQSSKSEYEKHKGRALELARERVSHYNQFYGFSVGNISVRNQKTRWGSCSRNGNLSFNYSIALLPPQLCDYIVVHELCHLGQFDHSEKFWKLVEKAVPDYSKLRKDIREIRT